jgi:hypothetical protein
VERAWAWHRHPASNTTLFITIPGRSRLPDRSAESLKIVVDLLRISAQSGHLLP